MNNNIAIKVENLTKIYHLYDNPKDMLKELVHPFRKKYHHDYYALNDVSFEIKKGETVGIIGKNGAGKSTLLKMITGVLTPTSGNITVNGKIASLLELGAGFNPEMSGYDNIYLNGTIMGFTKEEMDSKVDAIIAFADIGEFVYQPVKSYSSGMFARLAFSVAINVEPDILIVDEALSVGDATFQSKCIAKMQEMMRKNVTILFVSHDIYSIQSLCNKAVFLKSGKIEAIGEVENVIALYSNLEREAQNNSLKNLSVPASVKKPFKETRSLDNNLDISGKKELLGRHSGNQKITILDFSFHNEQGEEVNKIVSNHEYTVKIAIKFNSDLEKYSIVCALRSLNGVQEIGVSSSTIKYDFPPAKKDDICYIEIKSIMNLQAGVYNLVLAAEIPIIPNELHEFAHVLENCLVLEVVWGELKFHTKFYTPGTIICEMLKRKIP